MIPNKAMLGKCAKELAIPAILAVVGVGAFALGRLSATSETKGGVAIQTPGSQSAAVEQARQSDGQAIPQTAQPGQKNFVASKNGTKYYAAGCAGASRIKPENEVWFATAAAAQAAGYSVAANCK